MNESRKLSFFLPNFFTALNMACGFASIIFSLQNDYYKACMIIMLGVIFDTVDGRIARLTGTQSVFGEQFDSISDVISFGMAPAILIYHRFLIASGRLGLVLTFLYLLCGALRLARFNSNIDKKNPNFFQGLPIPAAAMALVGYVLISIEIKIFENFSLYVPMGYMAFYSILMISNIPFCSFKNSEWVRIHRKRVLVIIFLLVAFILTYEEIMLIVLINIYVLGSLVYFLINKGKLKDIFLWKNEIDEEN